MSDVYVVDTHALFWHLINSPKLSVSARQIFMKAFEGNALLVLSPIVLLELYGITKKFNPSFDFATELTLLAQSPFQIESIVTADLLALDQLAVIPELHDRLIAALAFRLDAPIITRDPLIQACTKIRCIW